ncbi:NAD(P)-dependent oxidoreductase [Nonomuraea jiangxiensis]|uniref:NAD binding domain of 6-phosphogluconate dehydrogenase n=1 Tax=Nonomuraea jiangxiensis TaxID=633440 RepID=A0A1G8TQ53_9ACTN|nr:NAD(P)-binding domain-containing protein [Nonomuraea jiangxiensis]SDJ43662.1 NAD binding domain of 6-phosphogluconate dehydrogenase [Nonomuraea jiangxiensis]
MTDDNRTPVTVIGLGAMGRSLAGAFLDSGHPTTVWNRSAGRSEELAGRGATVAATAAEAIAASPIVVICVLDYDVVHEILDPLSGSVAGRTLVNLTNGTPRQARETAGWAADHGADYLDGGIMAVPMMIGRPEALVLYSGSAGAFDVHRSTLGTLGTARYLHADAGQASLYDLALLAAMYGMFGGFYHAAAMLGSEKVPSAEFAPLVVPWLNAMVGTLPVIAEAMDSGAGADDDSNLRMQLVSFANILTASREQGVSTELLEPMRALLDRAVTAHRDGGDVPNLVELLRADPTSAG